MTDGAMKVIFVVWSVVMVSLGFGAGSYMTANKAQEVIVEKATFSDVKDVVGTVWYSQKDKVWKFMSGNGFNHASHNLFKTESLERWVADYKRLLTSDQRGLKDDCSVAVMLTVRIVNVPKEIMPGYSADYEVVAVHQMSTDFCFHCEHATKAERE